MHRHSLHATALIACTGMEITCAHVQSLNFDGTDFALVDTLFSLAEAYLFMQLVEFKVRLCLPHLPTSHPYVNDARVVSSVHRCVFVSTVRTCVQLYECVHEHSSVHRCVFVSTVRTCVQLYECVHEHSSVHRCVFVSTVRTCVQVYECVHEHSAHARVRPTAAAGLP